MGLSLRNQSRQEVESCSPWMIDSSENAYLMRCLDDYGIWGLKNDVSLTQPIMYSGHWEAWITSWFTHNIQKDMWVIDVGANIGYYTMLFDRLVGPNGLVQAYECNPTLVDLLQDTVDYNESAAEVIEFALSDVNGEATLTFPGDYTGSASLTAGFDAKYGEQHKIQVSTTTLDWELQYYANSPDLIKLDIEGAEELAWNGMRKTLFDHPDAPVVVLEYTPGAYTDTFNKELFDTGFVTGIGYDGKEHPVDQKFLDALTDWYMLVWRRR